MAIAASALAIAILTATPFLASRLRFLDVAPRSRWLSTAGGVSTAYVFVHLLPELAEAQRQYARLDALRWLDRHVYLLALAGLVCFYSLERHVRERRRPGGKTATQRGAFWLHAGSFSLYSALIGFLIGRREEPLLWFTSAMAVHFVVTDHGLREDHAQLWDRRGRWLVASGVPLGWITSLAAGAAAPPALVAGMTAFLAGGVVLNVLKEELPAERQSRLLPFVAGAFGYAALLLLA